MDLGAFWSFLIKNKTLGGSLWLFKLLSLLNHWKVDSGTRSVSGLRFTAPFPGVGTGLIHSCCRAGRDESLSEGSKAAVSSHTGCCRTAFAPLMLTLFSHVLFNHLGFLKSFSKLFFFSRWPTKPQQESSRCHKCS